MSSPLRFIELAYASDLSVIYSAIRDFSLPVWLDSGRPTSTQGRYDIISAHPITTLDTRGRITTITPLEGPTAISSAVPFDIVKSHLDISLTESDSTLPFIGGALGYFGYDLGRHLEHLPDTTTQLAHVPDMLIGIYPWAVVTDHEAASTTLVINQAMLASHASYPLETIITRIENAHVQSTSAGRFSVGLFTPHINKADYTTAFERIQHYIHAGDCYQINFAQPFSATCAGDNLAAYLQLRQSMGSPYSGLMEWNDGALLCLSPERFIRVNNSHVETKPIKGTVARAHSPEADDLAINWLASSEKNRAENIMIVDLLRNDLSKHCSNVQVPLLCEIESFPNVHHLVSTVTATRHDHVHPMDILRDAFPGGSITGAPKVRAMEIIDELETVKRSIYCGSLGYLSANGNMDTNIAIRSLIRDKDTLHCWGGGGIVADSIAHHEYDESIAKVKRLLATLENNNASA